MAGAFQTLDPRDLLISNENVTNTVWLNNSPTITAYYTSSVQVASTTGQFYYNVFFGPAATGSVQFAIAYCDQDGSGSLLYNPNVNQFSPSRTNYGQYRSLIIGDEGNSFVFGNQSASFFYALPVERSGYKEELLPGVMTLCISGSGTSDELYLTDDSKLGGAAVFSEAGRIYNLVSGSAGTVFTGVNANGWTANSGSYGWFLPDIGTVLLNGPALQGTFADGGIALATTRNSNQADNNPEKLFNRLNLGGAAASSPGWTLNSNEQLSSDFVFVRARSDEFNYSTNPSFISGSTGAVLFDSFINDPQVYITSVGLYNNNQELVAVAKLSRPLLKDFTKELLVRVKLDF
jgi:hypothetical protein|tara:strand:+ start:10637 stop:11680 length:1044 start_codon:yes stop_codon:yes gene_type:complete